ncbi:MAG: dephospho-CoA kinase [Clostridia bacterium]|nr:dephospho-CoA kinase [Clostridia bacterium]
MYIIGICGRSGSGKSTVAGFLRSIGAAHIDADRVCHEVYDTNVHCINELRCRFGDAVVRDGRIHRPTLAARAYSEKDGIKELNRIAHKYIVEDIEALVKSYGDRGKRVVLLDAPLLFESGLDSRCDKIIAVVAPCSAQLKRLADRDGKTAEEIKKRLSAQISVKELVARSDAVVVNDCSLGNLRKRSIRCMLGLLLALGGIVAEERRRLYAYKTR